MQADQPFGLVGASAEERAAEDQALEAAPAHADAEEPEPVDEAVERLLVLLLKGEAEEPRVAAELLFGDLYAFSVRQLKPHTCPRNAVRGYPLVSAARAPCARV